MNESVRRILDYFDRRQRNYQMAFSRNSPPAQQVLADLEEFCHANKTTAVSKDPVECAIREGRRQVWLRITRAIHLSPEEQFVLAQQKDKP